MLFMGEEWAATTPFPFFSDYGGELAEAVRRGRAKQLAETGHVDEETLRRAPDPQAESTFLSAKLRWEELNDPRTHGAIRLVSADSGRPAGAHSAASGRARTLRNLSGPLRRPVRVRMGSEGWAAALPAGKSMRDGLQCVQASRSRRGAVAGGFATGSPQPWARGRCVGHSNPGQ